MLAAISVIIVLSLSLLITRIAAVALTLTGLSQQSARFQARSAFTGVGFTTNEAEKVVNHPVRRRILMLLMLLGNAGIVTAVSSIILAFVNITHSLNILWRVLFLAIAITILWVVAASNWVDRRLSPLISFALKRWTNLDVRDYARVLNLAGEYSVVELEVEPQDWVANRALNELHLSHEGVLVLGIRRADGHFMGTPTGTTAIHPGDTLVLYGRSPVLADLDNRPADYEGEYARQQSVQAHQQVLQEQEAHEEEEQQPISSSAGVG